VTLRRRFRFAAAVLVLGGEVALGAQGAGPLPPLGPLLDPASGIWRVAATAELPASAAASVPGLGDSVTVLYDDRAVPHIFARTEPDAYRALGYVVARDRLFQLELQSRAGAGTLSELAGARALPIDRATRGRGMPRSAERRLAALSPDSEDRRILEAYAAGVNAWIDGLAPGDLPFEYRLLNRRPSRWMPVNSFHLSNEMGFTLAFSADELARLAVAGRVGQAAAAALYPANSPIQEPIQPNGRAAPRFDFAILPPPGPPDTTALAMARALREGVTGLRLRQEEALGSNNWAVAPRRTKAGAALLAGDPHLDLTIPSIWYEAHLVVPGSLDVYGVTIPGLPAIVIGFNRDVAWSFSNTGADVTDYYAETVDDSLNPTRYRLDGAWRPLELRVETYRGPRGETVATDTGRYTHRGPLRKIGARWISMRWTLLEDGRSLGAFHAAARAKTVAEWQAATRAYGAPAQNMLVADRRGTIAIRSTGTFPIRPGDGRGDVLRDGSTGASDWTGAWSLDELPQATDPAQGFLASANQQPIDPQVFPRYLGVNWYAPWRAIRINQLLRSDSAVTPDAMRRYQTDPGSPRADLFVPAFLSAAETRPGEDSLRRAAALLAQWDRRYTKANRRAVLFEYAMQELSRRLWDELRDSSSAPDAVRFPMPNDAIVAELLRDPGSAWWDDRRTPDVVEHRDDILAASLVAGLRRALTRLGDPEGDGWLWSRNRTANIPHVMRLPGLGAPPIPVQGGPSTINPSSGGGGFGPSWRMVVELGATVRAWGTYPGGQSGNPASSRYLDHLALWEAGVLDTLRVPSNPDQLPRTELRSRLMLVPAVR